MGRGGEGRELLVNEWDDYFLDSRLYHEARYKNKKG